MKVIIINGPNLNLLGVREPGIYGKESMEIYLQQLRKDYPNVEMEYYQSNIEGELINKLQEVGFAYDGIVLNAGAYPHTSLALADALSAITPPAVEVHISNVYQREQLRQQSLIARACRGSIVGFGMDGYRLAIEALCSALPPSTNK